MIELRIQGYDDRRSLCAILANAGYAVKVEARSINRYESPDYYVQVFGVTGITTRDEDSYFDRTEGQM